MVLLVLRINQWKSQVSNMSECVQGHSAVLIHFTLKLSDGSTAESTLSQGKPVLFRLGDGSLSCELENQLIGLQAGDQRQFTLPAEAVFGTPSPDLIQYFNRRDFCQTGVPDVGTIMLFTSMNGNEMPGIVREVAQDSIVVDFNHPLAGQAVFFDIEVLAIDPRQEQNHANIIG